MTKLDKVIAALGDCTSGECRGNCPYDGDGYCKDRLMRDAIAELEKLERRLKVALAERDAAWAKIARMTGERWDVPPLPTNGEESVPEFPREGM